MNYLLRYSALGQAMRTKLKEKTKEERDAEFDKLRDFFMEMINENTSLLSEYVESYFGEGKTRREKHLENICKCMIKINDMCSRYEVESMFPEAEAYAGSEEIGKAYQTYMDQLSTVDRLSHDKLGEALKTGNFDEYFKLHDYLTENIEEILKQEESGS